MTHYSMNIFQSTSSALLLLLATAAQAPIVNAASTPALGGFSETPTRDRPSIATPSAQLISQVGVLRLESSGDAVVVLQQQLTTLGYFSGVVTGFFGPVTEDAVRRFQQDAGLQADGIVGASTDTALQQRLATPATPTVTPTSSVLRLNDTGEQVSELQRRLTALGYFNGPVSGTFGPLTQAGVVSFQQANGLTADGIVGPGTADALRRATVPASQTPTVRPPTSTLLRRGDTGTRVADLQSRLRQLRFYTGSVNGNFGQNTEDAVRAFQRSQGLPEDGVAGPEVTTALERLTSASANPGTPGTASANASEQQTQPKEIDRYSVAELQRRLEAQGLNPGSQNDVLTSETRQAITQAQQDHGLRTSDLAK
jgi:peptidoglycan hydrolase-like protein with peptidoglycan-binding domain